MKKCTLEDSIKILKSAINYIDNPPLVDRNIDYKPRKIKKGLIVNQS